MSDGLDVDERQQLRTAKWRAMLWVTAGLLVIGVAQCAWQQFS